MVAATDWAMCQMGEKVRAAVRLVPMATGEVAMAGGWGRREAVTAAAEEAVREVGRVEAVMAAVARALATRVAAARALAGRAWRQRRRQGGAWRWQGGRGWQRQRRGWRRLQCRWYNAHESAAVAVVAAGGTRTALTW